MQNRLAGTIVGFFVMALMGFSTAPASASVWWLNYSDTANNLCMDVLSGSTSPATHVGEWNCNVLDQPQLFQLVPLADGNVWIQAEHSRLCVEVDNRVEGPTLVQDVCVSGPVGLLEEWQAPVVSTNPNGSVNVQFRNFGNQQCITGAGLGVQMLTSPCDSANPHQVWRQHLRDSNCRTCLQAAPRRSIS